MSGQIATFRDALKTALVGITGIGTVYDYPADNFSGFPAIVINSNGWDNTFSDTSRNRITYHFDLYLFQGINATTNEQTARKRIDDLSDTLIAFFNPQVHFAGAIKVEPIKGDAPMLVDRPNPMIMQKMTLDFVTLQAR